MEPTLVIETPRRDIWNVGEPLSVRIRPEPLIALPLTPHAQV